MCRIVMLLAFEGRECLTPAVAPPAGHWDLLAGWIQEARRQAAAGILKCHRLFTGSCCPADPFAFLLLSVHILCFLTLLPLEAKSSHFCSSPGAEGLWSDLISLLPVASVFPTLSQLPSFCFPSPYH